MQRLALGNIVGLFKKNNNLREFKTLRLKLDFSISYHLHFLNQSKVLCIHNNTFALFQASFWLLRVGSFFRHEGKLQSLSLTLSQSLSQRDGLDG